MKVIDVLTICECSADIYYKGQYFCTFQEYRDITNGSIEEWVLGEEVNEIDVNEDGYIDIYSR